MDQRSDLAGREIARILSADTHAASRTCDPYRLLRFLPPRATLPPRQRSVGRERPFSIIIFIPTMSSARGITRIWQKVCAPGAGMSRFGHRIEPAAMSPFASRPVKFGAASEFTGSENHASGPDRRLDGFSVSYG